MSAVTNNPLTTTKRTPTKTPDWLWTVLNPVRAIEQYKSFRRWKHRNDLHQSLPFLEGIGMDFRVLDNHGHGNRLFVRLTDKAVARLEKLGFQMRNDPISLWQTMFWSKYALAVELVPEDSWEQFCKAHAINEAEYPSLERIFSIIVGEGCSEEM